MAARWTVAAGTVVTSRAVQRCKAFDEHDADTHAIA